MRCIIRGYEVIIRSDDSKRDTITVSKNSIYNVTTRLTHGIYFTLRIYLLVKILFVTYLISTIHYQPLMSSFNMVADNGCFRGSGSSVGS